MAKFLILEDGSYLFNCPGCKQGHRINELWQVTGGLDEPTVSPSILVNSGKKAANLPVCHSFIKAGSIEFLSDCDHKLAGKTVELKDIE